jgi:hypothetical protein
MIESREQRKKSSLLRRRKIIIIISVLLVIISGVALYFVNDYVNNVIPYVDEADGTTYYIKSVNGIWKMYDKNGVLLPTEEAFGYYVTECGTLVEVKDDTGVYYTRAVPDTSDGELTEYEKVLIFKHIETKNIRSIEIHNQSDVYKFYRFDINNMRADDKADFVLSGSPLLTLKKDTLSALAVAAGYPLATMRVDDYKTVDGQIDLAEYGLAPEKRTKIEKNEKGEEITVEYDYTPTYYILTTTSGERFKMIIGDCLVNGLGYYAQYVELDGDVEKPRNKIYVLGDSIKYSILSEAKTYITPGIAYPVTQNDYFDVTDFVLKKKVDGAYKSILSFSFIPTADRTGTVKGSKPYVFTDERSKSYQPNYDKIDTCLLAFMQPNIIDIAVLSPSSAERAKYGLMTEELDAEGNPILNENGTKKYIYNSEYTISFKRTAKDNAGNKVNFLQTVYISKKNPNGNYYSYTTLEFLDNTEMSKVTGITFDMICEVSADTFNFLSYDEFDWTYPYVLETGIKYATDLKVTTPNYSATFKIDNIKNGEDNAVAIVGSASDGKSADTFGLLKFTDAQGNNWLVTQTDVKVFSPDGKTEMAATGKLAGTNDIGERVKYLEKPIKDASGNVIYVKLNEIKIDYANGTTKSYVRHQTMIFKKLYQSINSLAIIDDYTMTKTEEEALIADPTKYLATVSLTNNEGETVTVDFYSLTSRKAYIVVNGEGGYYVSTSAVQRIFDNCAKFFNCEDIK